MAITGEENRVFPRINLHAPLRYQTRGMPEASDTICDNISMGGVGLINNEFIVPQTAVALEINILSRILKPLGKIIWSSPIAHSDTYRTGVEFLEFGGEEKKYLNDFIDMQMGKL